VREALSAKEARASVAREALCPQAAESQRKRQTRVPRACEHRHVEHRAAPHDVSDGVRVSMYNIHARAPENAAITLTRRPSDVSLRAMPLFYSCCYHTSDDVLLYFNATTRESPAMFRAPCLVPARCYCRAPFKSKCAQRRAREARTEHE